MNDAHKTMHRLALGTHGAVGALALLMAAYNRKQGNNGLALLYVGLAVFEVFRVLDHVEDVCDTAR